MYILLRFYSPTWFPLSNPFPPATSPYLQFDLFDVHGSIYPIRLAPSRGDTRLRDLRGAVPRLSGSEALFAARPTSPLQRERHSPEFILSSFWGHWFNGGCPWQNDFKHDDPMNLFALQGVWDHTFIGKRSHHVAPPSGTARWTSHIAYIRSCPGGTAAIALAQTIGILWDHSNSSRDGTNYMNVWIQLQTLPTMKTYILYTDQIYIYGVCVYI